MDPIKVNEVVYSLLSSMNTDEYEHVTIDEKIAALRSAASMLENIVQVESQKEMYKGMMRVFHQEPS